MMQPYAGPNYGFHTPLHKNAEVLLTFVGGNPDRPIIAAAVPNPEQAAPVTSENQTKSVLKTAANNRMEMEDNEGHERILLSSPAAQTFLRMGSHNDPDKESREDGFVWSSDENMWLKSHGFNIKVLGNEMEFVVGGMEQFVLGALYLKMVIGAESAFSIGGRASYLWPQTKMVLNVERGDLLEERTRVLEQHIEAAESKIQVGASRVEAVNADLEAVTEKVTLANEKAEAILTDTQGVGARVEALNAKTRAVNEKAEAVGAAVEATQERVSAVNTRIVEGGARISELGERLTAANTIINDSDLIVQEAGDYLVITGINQEE